MIIIDFFSFNDLNIFIDQYDFEGIELFTLVVFDKKSYLKITELRWSGKELLNKNIENSIPNIWSAVTLYTPEVIAQRDIWFRKFLETTETLNPEKIIDIHYFGGKEDIENGINMKRNNNLNTISISQIIVSEHKTEIIYNDLQSVEKVKFSICQN